MRTITSTLYLFDELPTEKAKEKARDWARDLLRNDPPWLSEHSASFHCAKDFCETYKYDSVEKLKMGVLTLRADPKSSCPWTGYVGDEAAIDGILEACETRDTVEEVIADLRDHMNKEWDAEMEATMEDENIDDFILANGYEFMENGQRALLQHRI